MTFPTAPIPPPIPSEPRGPGPVRAASGTIASQTGHLPANGLAARVPHHTGYVMALAADGTVDAKSHSIPALPLFQDAFTAFLRGTVFETASGPVAVEDLTPGDAMRTAGGRDEPLIWIGRITLGESGATRNLRLVRILADSFGLHRPLGCVVTGPAARVHIPPRRLRSVLGSSPVLTPVRDLIDGINVIDCAPPGEVDLYHLGLRRHAILNAAGMPFESYHPGQAASSLSDRVLGARFLALFPHIRQIGDFGPLAAPRGGDTAART